MCDNEWHSFNDEMMFEINQCYRSNSKLNSATTEKHINQQQHKLVS